MTITAADIRFGGVGGGWWAGLTLSGEPLVGVGLEDGAIEPSRWWFSMAVRGGVLVVLIDGGGLVVVVVGEVVVEGHFLREMVVRKRHVWYDEPIQ